jgi:hypothetical protein
MKLQCYTVHSAACIALLLSVVLNISSPDWGPHAAARIMRTGGVGCEQGAFWAKKCGQGTLPDGEIFLGCRKVGF